jgi:CheY-like chemotaxis protein
MPFRKFAAGFTPPGAIDRSSYSQPRRAAMQQSDRHISPPSLSAAIGPNHVHRSAVPPRRVLVADDSPEIRQLVARFLQRHGYDVTPAENGYEAWRMFQQAPYDLVITDLKMPVMDGAALMARIKAMAPETPVVIITGQLKEAARDMVGSNDRAEAVLTKPFDFNTLLKTLATLIEDRASAAAITITV